MHPSILQLQIHLPNMQSISFRSHENIAHVINNNPRIRTMLTEFFEVNKQYESNSDVGLLYSEMLEHYICDKSNKILKKRQHKGSIGRLVLSLIHI